MSIRPEHMYNIATRMKNHEYRRYLLPPSVLYIWFYTTAPLSRIEYIARISHGKFPGEVPENGGIGNEEFNAGNKESNYGYEILDLWRIKEPISLQLAISEGYLKGAPQKYCWVSPTLLQSYPLSQQDHIIIEKMEENAGEKNQHDLEEYEKTSNTSKRRKISDFFTTVDPINKE